MTSGATTRGAMRELVVGLDGSAPAEVALRWAAGALAPGGRLHAIHAMAPVEELAVDAVLADSVKMRHRREDELATDWVAPVADAGVDVTTRVVEGPVAASLLAAAHEAGADAIAVGHRPHPRFGPQVVGHVTADLLRHADVPVVVVPHDWQVERTDGAPVVVGVGIAAATRAAVSWGAAHATAVGTGLSLVHALGPRSLFRPDGLLDVLAYHLDPTVLPAWVEEDLLAVADEIAAEAGCEVDMSISVLPGRIGPRLVEAGHDARVLVIGRGEAPFQRYAMAPYLHHALTHAPCPIVVVPVVHDES